MDQLNKLRKSVCCEFRSVTEALKSESVVRKKSEGESAQALGKDSPEEPQVSTTGRMGRSQGVSEVLWHQRWSFRANNKLSL